MFSKPPAAALGLTALLLSPGAGWAGESLRLTWSQALTLARQRSPELIAARARVEEARGALSAASPFLGGNPSLQLEAGPRRTPDGPDGFNLAVGLSQPVELGGKRGARVDAAKSGLTAEEARARDAGRLGLAEAGAAFIHALYARQRAGLAQEAKDTAEELERSAERRFEAGEVAILDVNVARAARVRAQAERLVSEGQLQRALADLRRLLGLTGGVILEVEGDLAQLALEASPPSSNAADRPDVAALESELEQARAELRRAEAQAWPDIAVGVGYEREGREEAVLGTVSVPLPIFARGQGERQSAQARVNRLGAALEAARRARDDEAWAAGEIHRKNAEASRLLQQQAMPLVEENLALSRKAYQAGEMGLAELLVIRRDALEARAQYLDRLLAANLSRIHLLIQNGELR